MLHLKSCQTSTMELSCKNNQRLQHIDHYHKKAPPQLFDRTLNVSKDSGFYSFLTIQNHFQSWHKVTNNTSIDITLMFLLQYLDTFLSTLCTWRVRSSRPEEVFKDGVIKISTKSTGKHLRGGLFCSKAASWWPATSLNTESVRGSFLWILRKL